MGRRVAVSTLTNVVFSTVRARLYSLMYVSVGATTKNACWHTRSSWFPDTKPGRVLKVADVSSGHRFRPVEGSVGQNSYGSMRHTWMLL